MEGLTEGRMVHYVFPEGEHRPAIIVKVWSQFDGVSNIAVFVDGANDGFPPGENVIRRTSIRYSAEPIVGTWHWIEKA